MKNLKKSSALFLLVTGFAFGACSQNDPMDEIIDNIEINSPSDPSDEMDRDKPGTKSQG